MEVWDARLAAAAMRSPSPAWAPGSSCAAPARRSDRRRSRRRGGREASRGAGERLRRGLAATRQRLVAQLDAVLGRGPRPLDVVLGELEEVLVGADVGVRTTRGPAGAAARSAAARGVSRRGCAPRSRSRSARCSRRPPPPEPSARPWVILVTGVNGVGKTTTIGKLAALHAAAGRRVLLVAADTFRAAAIEQLAVWAERAGADLVRHDQGADPSAVVFDGLRAAVARHVDVVLIDTAGRLHTRGTAHGRAREGGPRRSRARSPGRPTRRCWWSTPRRGRTPSTRREPSRRRSPLSGVVLTKLDGTARGGVLVAIRHELGLPIRYVGVGEGGRRSACVRGRGVRATALFAPVSELGG